jgi:sugar phosphate isomerase/epimerase
MNTLSFITANFVAQQLGYRMTAGWMQGDAAAQAHYRELETFAARFEAMLCDVQDMGFTAIDLWGAHLHPDWATDQHLEIARAALAQRNMHVVTICAWVGSVEQLEGFCRVARALGARTIAGGAPIVHTQRADVIGVLKAHDVRLGIENHPERSPDEVLRLIGDGADGRIGASPDTGWWATQGYSAPDALRALREHLFSVHLKDVLAHGAHETCRFGRGVADIRGCVRALREIGYTGNLGVEHEPEGFDPRPDLIESRRSLEAWLREP